MKNPHISPEKNESDDEEQEPPTIWVEPGPNMRWFEQGFYMGLGFAAATFAIWFMLAIILVIVLSR